jgi:hypothetical protein
MQLLANAADDAKVIIGDGLVNALTKLTDGNVVALADSMRDLATETQYVIIGIGELVEMFKSIPGFGKLEFDVTMIPVLGAYLGFFRDLGKESVKTKDALAEMMKYPDPQSGRQLDARLKIIAKTNKALAKAEKERLAAEKKKTAELKKQEALAKAKAVLDKADSVFNMDLIQNTAALMGKVTADETLRLKLQQAILLGNAGAAGNLAQELLASQIAAMKLSSTNPLGGFSDALKAALDGVRSLRDELAKLGAAKVPVGSVIPIPVPGSILPPGFGAPQTGGGQGTPGTEFLDLDYIDDFNRRNKTTGARTELVITIDPNAAAYGIGVASVNNSANGNSNNYSTIQSFQGGVSF